MDAENVGWVPDATALADFRKCPEVFRLRHRLGLRPPPSLANQAAAGGALHVAIDVWFRQPHSDPARAEAALEAAWEDKEALDQAWPLGLMKSVLERYAKNWPREADSFEVVQNEQYVEANIPLIGWGREEEQCAHHWLGGASDSAYLSVCERCGAKGFCYCGIIDRKLRYPDNSEYVVDLKSTGSYLNEAWFKTKRLSDQLLGYVALERASRRRCDGFVIDAVYVSNRATHSAPPFLREGPILVPDWRLEKWARDTVWTLQEIARLEAERGLDRPWPVYHNWAYGKPDAFWAFIEQPPELHTALEAAFVKEPWKPKQVAEQRQQTRTGIS